MGRMVRAMLEISLFSTSASSFEYHKHVSRDLFRIETYGRELVGSIFRLLGARGFLGVGIFGPRLLELLVQGVLEAYPLV